MKEMGNDKASSEWLSSQKKSTRATYKSYWNCFLEFTGMTGDEILQGREKDKNYTWEKKVLDFKQWMIKEGYGEQSAASASGVVRGFFSYHRKSLQFRPTESRHLEEAKPKYEDYRFSREDLKRMSDVAKLTEKYVVVVGKSFGLRAGDFLAITRGDLEAYIDREPPISIGEYQTEKENVKAYPFIDRDAKPIIKLTLEKMDREGKTNPNDKMLHYKDTIELTRVLRRVAERAGIKHGNKRIRFHCLRKFLIDRISSFMSESKWKQIVGKAISEGAYVSPDLLRKDYVRAMSETCFTKAVSGEEMELLAKKEALKMLAKLQGTTDEEMKVIFRSRAVHTLADEVKVLEEITEKAKRETQTKGGSMDCQKIVSEQELPQLLAEGWEAKIVLPSGKIVVEKV